MRSSFLLIPLLLTACGTLEPSGADQPMQAIGAQYFEGELPGHAPDASAGEDLPRVTSIEFANQVILPGQANKSISGRVSEDAVAVAIRIRGLGDGYWLVPSGPLHPHHEGQRTWSFSVSFSHQLEAGRHVLAVVGLSEDGRAGRQSERILCASPAIPDNLHACEPHNVPPRMVASLSWGVDADLDIQVVTADGRVIDPSRPFFNRVEQGARQPARAARIDRDSVEDCVPDGLRCENFIIHDPLPSGTRLAVRAKLANGCGYASVPFLFEVYERRGEEEAYEMIQTYSRTGILQARESRDATGLLLTHIQF